MENILSVLLQLAALVLLLVGSWAIQKGSTWLGLDSDGKIRRYLQDGLLLAVDYGEAEARRRLNLGHITPEQLPVIRAEAARDYAQTKLSGALAHFGVDVIGLDQMLQVRLPKPDGAAHGLTAEVVASIRQQVLAPATSGLAS